MPPFSLVVCTYGESKLLERLLQHTSGLCDEIVIVHDGPDTTGVREVAEKAGAKFFECPRAFQQEPHWPFAWGEASNDWILRLDADEFPSEPLKKWLLSFKSSAEPAEPISGYTCIWPLWNGHRTISKNWPDGRIFLFNRNRVRFFGMAEQVPVPDNNFEKLEMILNHQPERKSYGFRNLICRRQAHRWREQIARSLMGKPSNLACWRWGIAGWPPIWEELRKNPLRTSFKGMALEPFRALRSQWRADKRFYFDQAVAAPLQHAMIGLKLWRLRRKDSKK